MKNTLQIEATIDQAIELGLRADEFEMIKEILGRTPNFTETAIYSVMWSEHCSYKNSILWLKTLPKDGPHMLVKAGEENAGLVDIGGGLGCVFKIESHNHPSALEPYQGAATGVGGINRDIFTMGARPIAQLNSLRFGDIKEARTKWLVKGVVKGIGDYGNAFGIPLQVKMESQEQPLLQKILRKIRLMIYHPCKWVIHLWKNYYSKLLWNFPLRMLLLGCKIWVQQV